MWSSDSDRDDEQRVDTAATTAPSTPPAPPRRRRQRARRRAQRLRAKSTEEPAESEAEAEAEDVWRALQQQQREREAWPRRASRPVVVAAGEEEGSAASAASGESGGMGRARSLTDDDLEELKGCVDLGFGFSYHEIPELCGTLPALELCYSMSQRFLDEHQQQLGGGKAEEAPAPALAVAHPASPAQPGATNWKISSPGDSPDEVKARLKYWAQAVACTVRLCT